HDTLSRRGDCHHARGTLAIHTHAGCGHRQPGRNGALTRNVGPLRALLEGCPHDDVLNFTRFDASAFQDRPNDRCDHARGFEIIERAAVRLGQPSPCGCYDYGFFHRRSPTVRDQDTRSVTVTYYVG